MTIFNPLTGRWYDKMGIKKLFFIGSAMMVVGTLGLALAGESLVILLIFNIIRSVAVAFLMMPLVTFGSSSLHTAEIPSGTSLMSSMRTVAGSFGSAVFMALVTLFMTKYSLVTSLRMGFVGLGLVGAIDLVLACYVIIRKMGK